MDLPSGGRHESSSTGGAGQDGGIRQAAPAFTSRNRLA
jgi:hypothetical protein